MNLLSLLFLAQCAIQQVINRSFFFYHSSSFHHGYLRFKQFFNFNVFLKKSGIARQKNTCINR